ncbi:MAG: four helix bundle protein [Kofleriaceae bacterium]|nr:four helix bundle protein [Kofleriaceae bacterium]
MARPSSCPPRLFPSYASASSVSVVLNLAEGSAVRDGRRRVRYGDALGSALETRAGIEVACAIGYIESFDESLQGHFRHIIGVLTKVSR